MSSQPTIRNTPIINQGLLDNLYILPTSQGNLHLPGITHDSAETLVSSLRHNYQTHHVYFNDRGFHNHSTHHLFAIYALGAPPELIKEAYQTHKDYLKPAFESPVPITDDNFLDHLADHEYYNSYLAYFSEYLKTHSPTEALERFIFSEAFNHLADLDAINVRDVKAGGSGLKVQPEMLNRFLAGLLHPMIHLSYGIEFGVPGQVAEGLAQAAIHPNHQTPLVPYSLFSEPGYDGTTSSLLSRLTASLSLSSPPPSGKPKRPTFAFHRRLQENAAFTPAALQIQGGQLKLYERVVSVAGTDIFKLTQEWVDEWLAGAKGDAEVEKRIEGMLEEVVWGNVLWYGVSGWGARGDNAFNADFFDMHLVTSAIFLKSLVLPKSGTSNLQPPLALGHRIALLQTYLGTSAGWHLSQLPGST